MVPMVKIDVDKPRNLRYDLNAMCEVERLTDKPFSQLDNSMMTIRIVLWAGLVHEDPDLTLQDVGGFIHRGNLPDINSALARALRAAIPTDEVDADAPKNQDGSTGLESGQSGATI